MGLQLWPKAAQCGMALSLWDTMGSRITCSSGSCPQRQSSTDSQRAPSARPEWKLDKTAEKSIEQMRALGEEGAKANVRERIYQLEKSCAAYRDAGQPYRHLGNENRLLEVRATVHQARGV